MNTQVPDPTTATLETFEKPLTTLPITLNIITYAYVASLSSWRNATLHDVMFKSSLSSTLQHFLKKNSPEVMNDCEFCYIRLHLYNSCSTFYSQIQRMQHPLEEQIEEHGEKGHLPTSHLWISQSGYWGDLNLIATATWNKEKGGVKRGSPRTWYSTFL